MSHTLFLVEADEKRLEQFEEWEPETAIEDEAKPAVKHSALFIVLGHMLRCASMPTWALLVCSALASLAQKCLRFSCLLPLPL